MSVDPFLAVVGGYEALPVAVGICDLDGTIVAVNPAGCDLFARPAAQILGRKAWDFAPGADHIWNEVMTAARAGDYRGEFSIATPIGPRAIHYTVGLRSHAARTVAVIVVVELRTSIA